MSPADARPNRSRDVAARIAGCLVAAASAASLLAVATGRVERGGSAGSPDEPVAVRTAFAPAPTAEAPPRRRVDRRIPLYLVDSEEDARRLERALVATSYIELNNGGFAGPWAITVLGDGITFETIEHMNLARIDGGQLPYRVVDARDYP